MKIAIIGYGKMGKTIEQIAISRNHKIDLIIDQNNIQDLNIKNVKNIDVAIEFTNPEVAFDNIKKCLELNIPIVSGSTGWYNNLFEIEKICKEKNGSMLVSSNFSLGVNVFFVLNEYLAKMMNKINGYNVEIEEIHHTQKKDSPSGTAITTAEKILNNFENKNKWVNKPSINKNELQIISKRIEDVSGIHTVNYFNEIDKISITHEAFNRNGFALGSILAAEYIANKKGIFNMKEVLQIN